MAAGYLVCLVGTVALLIALVLLLGRPAVRSASVAVLAGNLCQLVGFMLLGLRFGTCAEAVVLGVFARRFWRAYWRDLVFHPVRSLRAARTSRGPK